MNKKFEKSIGYSHLESFETKNGLVSEDNIRFAKENILFDAMRHMTEIVETTFSYPEDNRTHVRFDLDVVILSRSRYQEMKDHEDKYISLCN